jgi:hypothetical protein
MDDFLGKLSSYNLLNYLLSGIVFVILSEIFTSYSFVQEDLAMGVFIYYFVGLVISRIGSLLVDPMLKWTKFVRFSDHSDFVKASKVDPKLEVLSEQNNVYRTLISVFVSIFFLKAFEVFKIEFFCVERNETSIFFIFILLLFLFGYRKQTNYIAKRIECDLKSHD